MSTELLKTDKNRKLIWFLSLSILLYISVYFLKDVKYIYNNVYIKFILTFLLSVSFVAFIKEKFLKNRIFIDRKTKEHAIHTDSIPRLGGLGIFLAVFLVSILYFYNDKTVLSFVLSALFILIVGLFEDYTQNIPPVFRLTLLSIPVIYVILVLNGVVFDVYYFELYFPIAFVITVFGVIGVINAINIIDGLNGLASGISLLGFLFFFLSVHGQNDSLSVLSGLFFFATLGFFLINITTGKIFLGDGGSYLLGFALSEISVLISNETSLSPWFPVALFIYPIWEVLFSIIRRKKQGKNAMQADKLHLHTLLYLRVFKKHINDPVKANSSAALSILFVLFVLDFLVFEIRENANLLVLYILSFVSIYSVFYRMLVSFKIGKFFAYLLIKREEKQQVLKPAGEIKS